MLKVTANDSRRRGPSGVTAFRKAVLFVLGAVLVWASAALFIAYERSRIFGTAQDLYYAGTKYYLDRLGEGELYGAERGIDGEWLLTDEKGLVGYFDRSLRGKIRICIDERERKVIEAEYQESYWIFTLRAVYPAE